MKSTIFDKILAKELPAAIVFEDEHVMAFKDLHPQAKTHVLVIPRKRSQSMRDLSQWTDHDAGVFFKRIAAVAESLGLNQSGYRVVLNSGSHGCQSVDYIHAHILGGEQLSGGFGV
jgi:histidine triad (HIT) family protein